MTVVLRGTRVYPDDSELNVTAARTAIMKLLVKKGAMHVRGGLDFSHNVDKRDEGETPFPDHLAPHFVVVVSAADAARIATITIRKDKAIKKPIDNRQFDGRRSGYAYMLKPEFKRRESYIRSAKGRNTRERELPAEVQVRLAVALDRAGIEKRLILIGYRLVAGRKGRLSIAKA